MAVLVGLQTVPLPQCLWSLVDNFAAQVQFSLHKFIKNLFVDGSLHMTSEVKAAREGVPGHLL